MDVALTLLVFATLLGSAAIAAYCLYRLRRMR